MFDLFDAPGNHQLRVCEITSAQAQGVVVLDYGTGHWLGAGRDHALGRTLRHSQRRLELLDLGAEFGGEIHGGVLGRTLCVAGTTEQALDDGHLGDCGRHGRR